VAILRSVLTVFVLLSASSPVVAGVVISEIMFNPKSSESSPNDAEWVELYNAGKISINISGWSINDGDGSSSAIASGTTIAPGQAIVLSSVGSAGGTAADFKAAWGTGFSVQALDFSAMNGLANSPSGTNEILSLLDGGLNTIDVVNFDDSSPWPTDSPDGPSIYLLPTALDVTQNDFGANWARSQIGVDGGIGNNATGIFNGADIGSPGVVATAVPEPSPLWLIAMIAIVFAVRVRVRDRIRDRIRQRNVASAS